MIYKFFASFSPILATPHLNKEIAKPRGNVLKIRSDRTDLTGMTDCLATRITRSLAEPL